MRRSLRTAMVTTAAIPLIVLGAATQTAGAVSVSTGSATGTVKDAATSAPLAGVCVNVIDSSTDATVGTSKATGSGGVWKLAGIPASTTYTAIAVDCKGGNYVSQWYLDQQYQPDATPFAVQADKTTKAIDFTLSKGGAISGKVTDSATGKPVADILVVAFYTSEEQASTFAECTGAKGTYKLKGVPTSGAKIEFVSGDCGLPGGYATVWFHNATSYATAKVVAVTAGATTKGISQKVTAQGAEG